MWVVARPLIEKEPHRIPHWWSGAYSSIPRLLGGGIRPSSSSRDMAAVACHCRLDLRLLFPCLVGSHAELLCMLADRHRIASRSMMWIARWLIMINFLCVDISVCLVYIDMQHLRVCICSTHVPISRIARYFFIRVFCIYLRVLYAYITRQPGIHMRMLCAMCYV